MGETNLELWAGPVLPGHLLNGFCLFASVVLTRVWFQDQKNKSCFSHALNLAYKAPTLLF